MSEKENQIIEPYTIATLLEDIQADYEERTSDSTSADMIDKNKLKLIRYLCKIEAMDFLEDSEYPYINRDIIERQLEENLMLFGYSFFLTVNSNCHYTWAYHQQKKEQYIDFLCDVSRFIHYLIGDINHILNTYVFTKNVSLIFYDFFEVKIDSDALTNIKVKLQWNNFHHLMKIGKGYFITLKINDAHVATKRVGYDRKHIVNLTQLFETTIQMINTTKSLNNCITMRDEPKNEK